MRSYKKQGVGEVNQELQIKEAHRRPLIAGQFLQQRLAFAEPRPLSPLHVSWERAFLGQQFLCPLAGLLTPVRRLQRNCTAFPQSSKSALLP
jgi:hypothetical protein